MPEPDDYRLDDSRRLTGGNLYWDRPSAIIDVSIEGDQVPIVTAWEAAAADWLACVGYEDQKITHRLFDGGASLLHAGHPEDEQDRGEERDDGHERQGRGHHAIEKGTGDRRPPDLFN